MFVPGALSGASDTYLTDYVYSHQSGISQTGVLRAGGAWSYGAKAGVDLGRVMLIRGWFAETLTPPLAGQLAVRRIAVAHVDCDLYLSAREVFAWLEGRVSPGTVVILDDWYAYDGESDPAMHGEQRALAESPLQGRLEVLYDRPGVHRILVVRD